MNLNWRRGDKPYVSLYSEPWKGGDHQQCNTAQVGPGTHYMGITGESWRWGPIKSLSVPSGLECRLRDREGAWQSPWFRAGNYIQHLSWWGPFEQVPCDVVVREVGYEEAELCRLWQVGQPYGYTRNSQTQYSSHYAVPPGLTNAGPDDFPNDSIRAILVPGNATATIYADGGGNGDSLTLEGGQLYDLAAFEQGWATKMSSIRLAVDGYSLLALEEDPDRDTIWTPGPPKIISAVVSNNAPLPRPDEQPIMLSYDHDFSEEVKVGQTFQWEAGGSVTATAGVEAEAGAIFAKAKVTASVSVEIHASVGGSRSSEHTRTMTDSIAVSVPPQQAVRAFMSIERGQAIVPIRRLYKNLRTGSETWQRGVCVTDAYGKTECSLGSI